MCYSFNSSIQSLAVSSLAGVFGIYTNQLMIGIFILFYSQIQLSEALIWKGIDTHNNTLNQIGTAYGKYTLPSHNIGIGLAIFLMTKETLPLIIASVFYLAILCVYYMASTHKDETYPYSACDDKSCQNDNNRLIWEYPHNWYTYSYLLSVVLILCYNKSIPSSIFLITAYTSTLLYSSITYSENKGVGSSWCFLSAYLSPIIVMMNHLILKN
jgi:hypothetical protein